MSISRIGTVFAAGALLALGACSSKPEVQDPLNETGANLEANVTEEVPVETNAMPAVIENTTTNESPPQPPAQAEQQVRDDADASGMTARIPADENTQPANDKGEQQK